MIKKIELNIILDFIIKLLIVLMPMATLGIRKLQFNVLIPLLTIIAIIQIYKNGFKISFYEKYMCIFVLTIGLSLIFTSYPIKLGLKSIKGFLPIILLPTLFGQFEIKDKYLKGSFISMLIGTVILFKSFLIEIKGVLQVNFGIVESWYSILSFKNMLLLQKLGINYRLKGDYTYIAITANVLATIIIISVIVLVEANIKKISKIAIGIFLLPIFYFFLLTQSRGSYLSLGIVFLLYFSYKLKKRIVFILITIFLIAIFLFNKFKTNVFMIRIKSIFKFDNSNMGRIEVYKEAINQFKLNIFTGVGFENFIIAQNRNNYKMHGFYYHPHNMELKLLSETGIIGFLSYYLLAYNLLKNLYKEKEILIKKVTFLIFMNFLIFENFEILTINRIVYSVIFLVISFGINSNYYLFQKTYQNN